MMQYIAILCNIIFVIYIIFDYLCSPVFTELAKDTNPEPLLLNDKDTHDSENACFWTNKIFGWM